MKKSRFTDEHIFAALCDAEATTVVEMARKHWVSKRHCQLVERKINNGANSRLSRRTSSVATVQSLWLETAGDFPPEAGGDRSGTSCSLEHEAKGNAELGARI